MSGASTEGGPVDKGKDPVVRFLVGCAVVAAVLVLVVGLGALLLGWQLSRDEAQGRAPESFLVGDETGYWCLDLKPNDAGLNALFGRLNEINDATRREILHGTFLEGLPLPRRRARLDELAPFTLELSLVASDSAHGARVPRGWAARGTFSRGLFRMRAAVKVMRWVLSRDAAKGGTFDVDGLAVTKVHDNDVQFAVATVGNRVLVASDPERMRAVLRFSGDAPDPRLAHLFALHREAKLEGEDAWAFLSHARVGAWSKPLAVDGAAASFDLDDHDDLAFRMVVANDLAAEQADAFRGTDEDCSALVVAFLPGIPEDAIELRGDGVRRLEQGELACSGRIPGVSKRLAEVLARASKTRLRDRRHEPREPETPSAIPTPPSPPPPSDPRSGTPAGPTREGTPKPPR